MNKDFDYLAGYVIDGKILMPAMGCLSLVWETMGTLYGQVYTETSVVFEDLNFLRVTPIPIDNKLELLVMIQKGNSDRFSLVCNKLCILTPKIVPTQRALYTNILF